MKATLSALIAGIIFGTGLIFSEMINPKKVQSFLDVAGTWDPTLAFVMGGALLVTAIGYKLIFKRSKPLYAEVFSVPGNRAIDKKLIAGALLFGAGWGLCGLCPGPAIVGASTFKVEIIIFLAAMIAGMKLFELTDKKEKS